MNDEAVMLVVAGKGFRCDCGCNVFHVIDGVYCCNACSARYIPEDNNNE